MPLKLSPRSKQNTFNKQAYEKDQATVQLFWFKFF